MVLTADKVVALVVMDKSQYVDKCMALLDDTKVYKPCKDTTKKLHRDVQETLQQLNREHGSSRLYWWSKRHYNKLLPTGNTSPAPRFYGLPKIHKANCPMQPIVSACGTVTYQVDKFLTKILQKYTGITHLFVIPVPTALDVINRLFTEHIEVPETRGKYKCSFEENTVGLNKNEVMGSLKLVLENCVFSFQGKFYKQLHGAAMGSPCSPVVANIYMEYFEELALGPEVPVPIKEWKRYMDDVFSIIPKGKRDILLNYLNSIDPHIKFTVEQPSVEGPFHSWIHSPNLKVRIFLYQCTGNLSTWTGIWTSIPVTQYLPKKAVVRALMDRGENVCSDPDILVTEIEHLGKVLRYNNYPQWLIDKWGKSEKSGPLIHPDTGHEIKKQFFISVPYFPGLSESFKKIVRYTAIQVCFKGVNTLKSILMHPKDKISIDQKKDIVYHWECQADGCKSAYVGETSRALGE